MSAATSVDLPAPGGPVIPTMWARAGPRIERPHRRLGDRSPVLDGGQQPGERATVAGERRVGQVRRPGRRIEGGLPHPAPRA